jgi:hypothetical protein
MPQAREPRAGLLATPVTPRAQLPLALRAVDTAFNTVVQRKLAINPSDSASIPRMRVACKPCRDMVEWLAPLLDWVTRQRLPALQAFHSPPGR